MRDRPCRGRPLRVAGAALLAALLLAAGGPGGDVPQVDAAIRTVRLEAGPHRGFRFASSGAVRVRKDLTLTKPTTVLSDRRHAVVGRAGWFIHLTSGPLAGWEVRESPVAYRIGLAGSTALVPEARITFAAGRYLGYRFEPDWSLASTTFASLTAASSARASRRAVINGRPYALMSSGGWAGTWMPLTVTGGTAAERLTCAVGPKPAPGSIRTYRRVKTTDRQVALTFDLGGRLTPAIDILERLIIDRVCSTIFPTGDAAQTTTGRRVMELVRLHPELFEIGNHTQHHCNLRDGGPASPCPSTAPSASFIWTELNQAEDVIEALADRAPRPYWRPPYGATNAWIGTVAAEIGYTKTILWDVDTIDWRTVKDGGPTAAKIAASVVAGAEPGSIVLMHLGGWHTYDALPSMLVRLRDRDMVPSTITDLLT